jgi:PAS domain S-box-containing protein
MSWLRFGTLAVESLSSTILLLVITLYLVSAKGKTAEAWFFTGYLGSLFILLLSYTLRYSIFSPASLATGQISNLIVFGVVCLIQFAYRYGDYSLKKEGQIAFAVTAVSATGLWISLFFEKNATALYDFSAQYFSIFYSPKVSIFVLICYIWAITVFVRKIIWFSRHEVLKEERRISFPEALRRPIGRLALSARSFTYLGLAYTVLSLLYMFFQVGALSRAAYTLIFNTGSLLICLLIFIVYVNNSSRPMSIMAKLVGIPLAVIMVAFGIASNALMPIVHSTLADRYRDDVSLAQLVLDSGGPGQVPPSIAFMLPEGNDLSKLAYLADDISLEWSDAIAGESGRWHEGLIPEKNGLKPAFIYLDLYDTQSFFFAYRIESRKTPYIIGFRYSHYRFEVHRFAVRILLAVVSATLVVVLIFPVAYRRALLNPIGRLLEAVRQVSSGNYRTRLPIGVEDELGQLARGYNDMALSLENAEGNFKALAENANDAILLASDKGRVLYANRRAVELSGYAAARLTDSSLPAFLPVEDVRLHARETRMVHKDGHTVPVEISQADTVWQGEPARVVVIRDITERKEAAEAIQTQQLQLMRSDKLASIGALVAGMAHEINNPNQAISMNFRFFADALPALFALAESDEKADKNVRIAGVTYDEFKETAAAAVSDIQASTTRIDHIARELKRFVQGSVSTMSGPTDVNEVVRVVADLSRHLINQATNKFSLELATDLRTITADRIGLEQVILNLLQNACQALDDRENAVTIRTSSDDDAVVVEVIDEGTGIKEEELPNITDSFFTTKTEAGGTGLGLAVSLRIVKEHGGALTFESTAGRGTTARVWLPRLR